ncbi:MAG: hypothetical protein M3N82_02990 [Pseudomonadota bacterium]|nr:hypothetical protein [Pseudomonadota bacterium]
MSSLPKRIGKPPERFGDVASKAQIRANDESDYDSDEDMASDDDDDFDWLPADPTRPPPYSYTWSQVYQPTKAAANTQGIAFTIGCAEGCGKPILLNGKYQEIDGTSTPHGKLRRPPVCHDIPWAHLRDALIEFENGSKGKKLQDDFKRYVCWGDVNNLRAGHNGCNSAGSKHTSATFTGGAATNARSFVARCVTNYPYGTVWA